MSEALDAYYIVILPIRSYHRCPQLQVAISTRQVAISMNTQALEQ